MTDASTWNGITDDTTAQWAITKLAGYHRELARLRSNAQAEIERIQTKALDDEAPVRAKIEHWTTELVGYRHRLEDADPLLPKTYKLPGGNLLRRAGRKSTVVDNVAEFVAWALDHAPAAIKYEPQVSVLTPAHGFRRLDDGCIVDADGEQVPGVQIVTGPDTYKVDLNTETEA